MPQTLLNVETESLQQHSTPKILLKKEKYTNQGSLHAKPFVKCAGGKTQLLDKLEERLPESIKESRTIERYIEPFVGGGAFFFYLKSKYEVKKSYLFDINRELVAGYKVIQNNPHELVNRLYDLQDSYLRKSKTKREELFYKTRKTYNEQMNAFDYQEYNIEWIERASMLIFFNKTCFNGLFRQNKKGEFNVPFGDYKNPTICDAKNIFEVNKALKDTRIICGDFGKSTRFVKSDSLVYLDPPYRPLNHTSSFTDYSKESFTDKDQIRLGQYFRKMDKKGAHLILSNSDPKNENPDDNFFDKMYDGYKIYRVLASRVINCNGGSRGKIFELIIKNYSKSEGVTSNESKN
jgi:DNA adenine methylase